MASSIKYQLAAGQRPILSKLLPIELKNRNDGRGHKHYRSASDRKSFERILRLMGATRDPFPAPVVVHLTRVLGKGQRLIDPDSILRGNAKEVLDSLVAVGWFADDSQAHIVSTQGFQDAGHREHGPATFIEVYDAAECHTLPSSFGAWLDGETRDIR